MNIQLLKNEEIIKNEKLLEFHCHNNTFVQQNPKFCFYNSSKDSESIVFHLFNESGTVAYANLSHFNNGKVNILTNTPTSSSHSSFSINKKNKYSDKEVIKRLYFEIQSYCSRQKIELFSFASNPLDENIVNYDNIIKPDLKFRNFLQILNLENKKIKLKPNKIKIVYEKLNEKNLEELYIKYATLFKKKNYYTFSFESFIFLKYLDTYIYNIYKDDELLNSTIIIKNNNILIEYYLSLNFNNKFRSNEYLINYLIEKFKIKNFKFLNFQSSKKINDGTFVFKKKFQPDLKYYFYLTKLFINKEDFTKKCHLYDTNDNRFVYPNYFNSLKDFNISYIR